MEIHHVIMMPQRNHAITACPADQQHATNQNVIEPEGVYAIEHNAYV